jgi:hypothetical protein
VLQAAPQPYQRPGLIVDGHAVEDLAEGLQRARETPGNSVGHME